MGDPPAGASDDDAFFRRVTGLSKYVPPRVPEVKPVVRQLRRWEQEGPRFFFPRVSRDRGSSRAQTWK